MTGFEPGYLRRQLSGQTQTPVKITQMTPEIYHVQSLGNAAFITTEEGVVVIDTGNPLSPGGFLAALRSITQDPIRVIIYTHGHVDHAANALTILNEAHHRGDPRPRILAHRNVIRRFTEYAETRGWQDFINRIQFALPSGHPGWPSDENFVRPDEVYDQEVTFQMGGLTFIVTHRRGETDDASIICLPERKAILPGDLFLGCCPNAGNPLKKQRYVREWSEALMWMASLNADILGPGHGEVLRGEKNIQDALITTAEALRYLYEAVIERMNKGQWIGQIRAEVKLPSSLSEHWALAPTYGSPDFIVCDIYRSLGGWYDGKQAHLDPSSSHEIADEVVGLAGASTLLARAYQLVDEGQHQLALHLLDYLLDATIVNQDLHVRADQLKKLALTSLAQNASSYITRNIFLSYE